MSRSTSASRYFSGTVAMARATAPCNCSRSNPASRLAVEAGRCGRLSEKTSVSASVETEFGRFSVETNATVHSGQRVQFGFRPEAVQIGLGTENNLGTRVRAVSYLGEIEQYVLELKPGVDIKAFEQNPLELRATGTSLPVHVRPQDCLLLPA